MKAKFAYSAVALLAAGLFGGALADGDVAWMPPATTNQAAISDMRVEPFVAVKWGQGDVEGLPCYNFSTPGNRKTGCAATALAQLLRHWEHPVETMAPFSANALLLTRYWPDPDIPGARFNEPLWTDTVTNRLDSSSSSLYPLPGGGDGRFYDWSLMPFDPAAGVSDDERAAIGALCFDAALSLGSEFRANYSTNDICLGSISGGRTNVHSVVNGSSDFPEITTAKRDTMAEALRTRFGYANAYVYDMQRTPREDHVGLLDKALFERVVNANLDAGRPVVLVMADSDGHNGHYAVADGYGYVTGDDGLPHEYVHLNLGWDGEGDGWYRMPKPSTEGVVDIPVCEAGLSFSNILAAVYNVSPDRPGAILSGRLGLEENGEFAPRTGLSVQVYDPAELRTPYRDVVSGSHGVYSVDADFPTSTNLFLEAHYDDPDLGPLVTEAWVKVNQTVADQYTFLVTSSNSVGNVWGCDLVLSAPKALVDGAGYASLERAFIAAERSASPVPTVYITDEIDFGSIEWKIARDMVICCTNEEPSTCAIKRPGSGKIVVEPGIKVLFTNVCFQALGPACPVVEVKDGGTCAIGGKVEMDSIRVLQGGSLEVVSALDPAYCYNVDDANSGGEGGVFATYTGTGDADASAALFIHATDERLCGEAQAGGSIAWAVREVPDSAAVLRLEQGGQTVNYRSFDMLLKSVTDDCRVIVLEDCVYTNSFTVAHKMEITSDGGAKVVSSPRALSGGKDGFVVAEGGELKLSNVAFTGHNGGEFVVVDGGEFILDDGAVMEDIENAKTKYGGALYVKRGKATVKEGASASNTRATCTGSMGGFACVSPAGEIELLGGTITGCRAQTFGGAVYAAYSSPANRARVRVGGPAVVRDNTAISQSTQSENSCDVYIASDGNPLELSGDATGGSIGLQYVTSSYVYSRNIESNVFAVVTTDGLDQAQLEGSAMAFFNNTSNGIYAVVAETPTGLVWAVDHPVRHFPLDEADIALAKVRVTYLESGVVEYWEHVDWALNSITNDASVELLADDRIAEKVSITNNVVLFAASEGLVCRQTVAFSWFDYDAGGYVYTHSIDIAPGASLVIRGLSVEDSSLAAYDGKGPLFNVGGELVLDAASVSGVDSSASVGDCAVWIPHGGVFTMTNNATIVNCLNSMVDPLSRVGSAVRSFGGTVNLSDCTVTGCEAADGGALYFGSATTVNIGGGAVAAGNISSTSSGPANMLIAATLVTLSSPLSGTVGITPVHGYGGSSNIFGRVSLGYPEGLESVTNSAAHFLNDETGERGIAVTNAEGEVYLAWPSAVGADGTFVDDHKVYSAIGEVPPAPQPPEPPPPPPPAEPTPVDFTAIYSPAAGTWTLTLTNAVTGCRYFLYSTNSLVGGFEVPADGTGAKASFTADADGEFSFTVPASGDAAEYFKVVGLPEGE